MLTPREQYQELITRHGVELPLDHAVALLAAEEQGCDPITLLSQLDALAASIHLPDDITIIEKVARINYALFVEQDFQGDEEDYSHPRNSLLNRVLERRRGLPILLSVVYLAVAKRLGVDIAGVNFPGHFVLRPVQAEPMFFIDPFHKGRILREEQLQAMLWMGGRDGSVSEAQWQELCAPAHPLSILMRVNQNLLMEWKRRGDQWGYQRASERIELLNELLKKD